MDEMIIVTSLFFNKIGNQSLYETIKYYSTRYHVTIITSASKKDKYYYDVNYINKKLDVEIIHVYQHLPNFLRWIRQKIFIRKSKKNIQNIPSVDLVNLRYTWLNTLSHLFGSIFLYNMLKRVVKKENRGIICAYEILAVKSVVKYMNYPKRNINFKYLAKFQGTSLGFDYINIDSEIIKKRYSLDINALKYAGLFDLCAITNDGTNGVEVLKKFNVDEKKIICLPNGISDVIKIIKISIKEYNLSKDAISLFTLSRLAGWKRVYLSIEIMNILVNTYNNKKFTLDIYGYGTNIEINYLNDLIKKYDLSNYIKIMGEIGHDDLSSVFNSHDFLLSLYKYTNVTNPVLESIFLDIPTISIHDQYLDKLIDAIKPNRVFLFKENTEDEIIKEIAYFLNQRIFKFSTFKTDYNYLSWEYRLGKELSLLSNQQI